jgi:diguanylate cyclase (GGDEF)-like protein
MSDSISSTGHPALTDEQTGLPNRLHFDTVFEVLFATGARGLPLTIIVMEMDGFDEWTREAESTEVDRLFRSIGNAMAPVVRKSDVVARIGETRFALCLMDCNLAGAVLVADRIDGILDAVRESSGLGFSMGGAAFDIDMGQPHDLLSAAEGALEVARLRGPDQMEFHR